MTKIDLTFDKNIAFLTIKNPPANALTLNLLEQLGERLDDIQANESAKVIIIKGEGKFFSAGADIKEFTSLQDADDYEALARFGQDLFDRIENFNIPVIAAIHGAALGGALELVFACHIRLVTEDTLLGSPEITLGIIPGFAGTQRLPQHVGIARAYEMLLTGEPINGSKALAYGLVNHVYPKENLFIKAEQLARKITAKSKPAISNIMKLVPYAKTSQFSEGVDQEAKLFGDVFGNDDAKEGIKAFIEKRKPNFQDR